MQLKEINIISRFSYAIKHNVCMVDVVCVLRSYAIKRIMQITGMRLSGIHCTDF